MERHLLCTETVCGDLLISYREFLNRRELRDECDSDYTALYLDDDGNILACGSLRGNVIKQMAVAPEHEGEGLIASLMSLLVSTAAQRGCTQLFLYTKPCNQAMMLGFGFYPVVQTSDVLMMENRSRGVESFLARLPKFDGKKGAVVCNCDPFTLGHQKLIETAASCCDAVYVFVLSENGGVFSTQERVAMVKAGTEHIPNVFVTQSSSYLVSRATFPTYFIKETSDVEKVQCELDVALFSKRIAPALDIRFRFVGREPYDPVTKKYNETLKVQLPVEGIQLVELPRFRGISASKVRKHIAEGRIEQIRNMLPETSYEHCLRKLAGGPFISG